MFLTDNHTHSLFSADSRMEIRQAIAEARRQGLGGLAFTDHFDFDVPEGVIAFEFDPAEQQEAIRDAAHGSGFRVCRGIEIGLQPQSFAKIRELLSRHRFDQIIASVHFVEGKDPYHGNYYIGKDFREAYRIYLEDILRCIRGMDDFDILGHYDYIARYAPYPESVRYADFPDQFDAILRFLAENGKSLELNTKTYYLKPDGSPVPDPAVYRRFRELGGEAISLGSDAHKTEHIGHRFREFAALAREWGFRHTVSYRDRKPEYFPL